MIEVWVIGLRAVQYVAAALLFGLPAFLIYSPPAMKALTPAWPRPALFWAAVALAGNASLRLVGPLALDLAVAGVVPLYRTPFLQTGKRAVGSWLGREPGFIKPRFQWSHAQE